MVSLKTREALSTSELGTTGSLSLLGMSVSRGPSSSSSRSSSSSSSSMSVYVCLCVWDTSILCVSSDRWSLLAIVDRQTSFIQDENTI